jgi:hypothetical protein
MLPPDAILARTEKGSAELTNTNSALSRELRMPLFFVDGQTTVETILRRAARLEDFSSLLNTLFLEGYVVMVGVGKMAVPQIVAVVKDSPAGIRAKLSEIAKSMLSGKTLEKVQQKIDGTTDSHEEWAVCIAACKKFIVLFVGTDEANRFADKAQTVLNQGEI